MVACLVGFFSFSLIILSIGPLELLGEATMCRLAEASSVRLGHLG